jgi:hypothetical protein
MFFLKKLSIWPTWLFVCPLCLHSLLVVGEKKVYIELKFADCK